MRFARTREKPELVQLTALIDCVFILLVFFMLAGSIRPTDAFPVDVAASRAQIFGDEREAVILIRPDGAVALGDRAMTRPELLATVAEIVRQQPDALVQLKADGDTDADLVIGLMEDLRESGVGYLVLLTKGVGLEDA
ncbi:MAG: ExbD/TolR family protein [Thermaurantiacus sp.]